MQAIPDCMRNVVVVGAGGTGCQVLKVLSAFGVRPTIIDRDVVEQSNLSRQILFSVEDLGHSKAKLAASRLEMAGLYLDLTHTTIDALKGASLVVDCTDNTDARLLINDFCLKNRIVWVHTAAVEESGTAMLIYPGDACYRCVVGERYGDACDSNVGLETLKAVATAAVDIAMHPDAYRGVMVRITGTMPKMLKVTKDPVCKACNGDYEYLGGKHSVVKLCGDGRYMLKKKVDLEHAASVLSPAKITPDAVVSDGVLVLSTGYVLVQASNEADARKRVSRL